MRDIPIEVAVLETGRNGQAYDSERIVIVSIKGAGHWHMVRDVGLQWKSLTRDEAKRTALSASNFLFKNNNLRIDPKELAEVLEALPKDSVLYMRGHINRKVVV